jgi:hypothetical protein
MGSDPADLEQLLVEKADAEGRWSIRTADALAALGVDTVDFYRRLYERRALIDSISVQTITNDNVLTLAAGAYDDLEACERQLHRRGIVCSVDHSVELASLCVEIVSDELARHRIDHATFASMLSRLSPPPRAFACYVDFYFQVDSFRERAVERFLASHPEMHPTIGRTSAARTLDLLFTRHIIDIGTLFAPLYDRLTRRNGGVGAGGSTRSRADGTYRPSRAEPETVREALAVFGLSQLPPTPIELKRTYRALMKTFHPDVNPAGLATSQRITKAYASLELAFRENR